MLITSERRFGIEIEFFCSSKTSLVRLSRAMRIVQDGSIRHIPYSGEFVSDILQGRKGEQKVHLACEVLKKNGASGDNQSMSVHVHLDGLGRGLTVQSSKTVPDEPAKYHPHIYGISNRLARKAGEESLRRLVELGLYPEVGDLRLQLSEFDGIRYLSIGELKQKPEKNFTYSYGVYPDRTKWLRNILYFYTQYSEVMESIVSNSRKFGNMYCIPLAKSYELVDIEKCNTEEELRQLWYKGRDPMNHYDDSRYHNVNLHSYWDRHGTVEIRSHGGTIDPNKILLWVKLHQKIADKLEGLELSDIKLKHGADVFRSFVEFVEEPILQSYIKRLLGFYSGISIK